MQTRKVIRFSLTGALMFNFIGAFAVKPTLMASQEFRESIDRAPAVEVSHELHQGEIAVDPGLQLDIQQEGVADANGQKDQLRSAQAAAIQKSTDENGNENSLEGEKKEAVAEQNLESFQIRADIK